MNRSRLDHGWEVPRSRGSRVMIGLALALIIGLAAAPSAFAYVVENPSFEQAGANPSLPALWPYNDRERVSLIDVYPIHHGLQCVRTAVPSKQFVPWVDITWYGSVMQDVAIPGGQPIRLKVWAKSNVPDATVAYMEFLTKVGGNALGSTACLGSDFGVNGNGWTQMRLTATAPANAGAVRIWLRTQGGDLYKERLSYWDLVELGPPDDIKPVTTVTGYPGGWVQWPVALAMSATDNTGLPPTIYYRIGTGTTTKYTAPVQFAYVPGVTNVSYWSVDNDGNVEDAKTITLRFGTPPPPTITAKQVAALSVPSVTPSTPKHHKSAIFSASLTPGAAATAGSTNLALYRYETKTVKKRVRGKMKNVKVKYWRLRATKPMSAAADGRLTLSYKLPYSGKWKMVASYAGSAVYEPCTSGAKSFTAR